MTELEDITDDLRRRIRKCKTHETTISMRQGVIPKTEMLFIQLTMINDIIRKKRK